uniref:Phytocyanin domain-containing protein n=1 Tax=Oryza meridionalis TaxID=40149 RepID=A0A0E0D817_9ORYZ
MGMLGIYLLLSFAAGYTAVRLWKTQMLAAAAAAVALAVLLPARGAAATEHMVGDGNGWILGFDYAAWAATKQFRVGDTLGT